MGGYLVKTSLGTQNESIIGLIRRFGDLDKEGSPYFRRMAQCLLLHRRLLRISGAHRRVFFDHQGSGQSIDCQKICKMSITDIVNFLKYCLSVFELKPVNAVVRNGYCYFFYKLPFSDLPRTSWWSFSSRWHTWLLKRQNI